MAFARAKPPVAAEQYSRPDDVRVERVSAPDPVNDHPLQTAGYAFPREARLLDGASFSAVFKQNRRLSDRYWTLLCHVPSEGEARLGLAIAKKRARRAHDRNRIKRVARESFRHHRAELGSRQVVLMNRDPAVAATTAELRSSLDRLWVLLLAGKARR